MVGRKANIAACILQGETRIAAGGYGIEWNEEIDISEHERWTNGTPVDYQEITDDLNTASIAQDATD